MQIIIWSLVLIIVWTTSWISSSGIVSGKWFDRIVIINLENTDYLSAQRVPYLQYLKRVGRLLRQYHAVSHPSQPNYVAQIYGDASVVEDDGIVNLDGPSLVTLLEARGISWKSVQENYTGRCNLASSSNDRLYMRKHNPFSSLTEVQQNSRLCDNIISSKSFDQNYLIKRAPNLLPQVIYYTPNMNNDGHDTNVQFAGDWLQGYFEARPFSDTQLWGDRTLFLVTFDEDEDHRDKSGDNRVFTVMFGSAVAAHGLEGTEDYVNIYTHYSLLRTIEENWELGSLGRKDEGAKPFVFTN